MPLYLFFWSLFLAAIFINVSSFPQKNHLPTARTTLVYLFIVYTSAPTQNTETNTGPKNKKNKKPPAVIGMLTA